MIFLVYDFQPRGATADSVETHDQGSSSLQQVPRGQHPPGHWGRGEANPDQVPQSGDNLQQVSRTAQLASFQVNQLLYSLAVGNIIETDNIASNGVIHVIDIVL